MDLLKEIFFVWYSCILMKSLTLTKRPFQHFSLASVAGTRGIITDTEIVKPCSYWVV